MAEAWFSFVKNDEALLRAVNSGRVHDIVALLQSDGHNTTTFSERALNLALIRACHMGLKFLIQMILQEGASLEARDEAGNTPLLICSEKGMADTVHMLLTKGADVNAYNYMGDSALILSSSKDVIHHLLNHHRLDVNHQNHNGYTALMSAIESWNLDKIKLFFCFCWKPMSQSFVRTNIDFSLLNSRGETAQQMAQRLGLGPLMKLLYDSHIEERHPLFLAAVRGDLQTCNLLFRYDLIEGREVVSIRPNILCVVLNVIKGQTVPSGSTETDLVRRLCEAGVDINICSDCNRPHMDIVLDNGNYDLAEVLCQHGAVIPHKTIVSLVEKNSKINFIPLLANYGAEMNQSDESESFKYPDSALDIALRNSKIDFANALLYHGAKIDVEYALYQAVENLNCEILKFLIDRCGTEVRTILESKPEIFNNAVTLGDVHILKLLLDVGADINMAYGEKTPIMNAVHSNVVKYLLQNGADINKTTTTTALMNCISQSYLKKIIKSINTPLNDYESLEKVKEILQLLIENGANIETADDEGNTVLIESVRKLCHGDIVQILLDNGSKINARNRLGQTALHKVTSKIGYYDFAFNDVRDLVELLCENHAQVNAQDNDGNTPLLEAIKENPNRLIVNILKLLISYGADVNHTNKSGMSALMLAVQSMEHGLISVLLESGCNVSIVSKSGQSHKTPLSIILNKWYPNWLSQFFASLLLDHGATSKYVRPDALHRLTAMNNRRLVHKLIVAGLGPSDMFLKEKLTEWSINTVSPLGVCLMRNNIPLAQYFIDHLYLTQSDVKLLSRDKTVLKNVDLEISQFLMEISAEPMRLETLSFITVSSSIGSGPDREEKVKKSLLPNIIQERLLFKKVAEMNDKDNDDNDDDFYFIKKLTNCQLLEGDSLFLEVDEEFIVDDSSQGSEETEDSDDDEDLAILNLFI